MWELPSLNMLIGTHYDLLVLALTDASNLACDCRAALNDISREADKTSKGLQNVQKDLSGYRYGCLSALKYDEDTMWVAAKAVWPHILPCDAACGAFLKDHARL